MPSAPRKHTDDLKAARREIGAREHTRDQAVPRDNAHYTSARWRRLRRWILRRHPLCEHCLEHDRTTPATEVDHIVPLSQGGTDETTNLQALCKRCHSRKTRREQKGA